MQRPGGEKGVPSPGAQRGATGAIVIPRGQRRDMVRPEGFFRVILGCRAPIQPGPQQGLAPHVDSGPGLTSTQLSLITEKWGKDHKGRESSLEASELLLGWGWGAGAYSGPYFLTFWEQGELSQ